MGLPQNSRHSAIASLIFNRIQPHLENLWFDFPDGQDVGQWYPQTMNDLLLFSKYVPESGFFAPHTDGNAVIDVQLESTLVGEY